MKRAILLLLIFSVMSCKNDYKKEDSISINSYQKQLNDYINYSCKEYAGQKNEILKDEYYENFISKISNLTDSINIFDNWYGSISKYKTEEFRGVSYVHLEITDLSDKGRNIDYKCIISIPKKGDTILVYEQLKKLKLRSKIFFSGVFNYNDDGLLDFDSQRLSAYEASEHICKPIIDLDLISITESPIEFRNSEIMKQLKTYSNDAIENFNLRLNNKITKKKFERNIKINKDSINKLFDSLSEFEKDYLKSMSKALDSYYSVKTKL